MASNASKWGCDVPGYYYMLDVFTLGEDETQVMMKEGGYPSVKWVPPRWSVMCRRGHLQESIDTVHSWHLWGIWLRYYSFRW